MSSGMLLMAETASSTGLHLTHFSASLNGLNTHAYLESIQADHTLAMRNIVVSENLLPLLSKQKSKHFSHWPPHGPRLRPLSSQRESKNGVRICLPPFSPALTSISSYSTSVPSLASATFLRVCKILQQSSTNT